MIAAGDALLRRAASRTAASPAPAGSPRGDVERPADEERHVELLEDDAQHHRDDADDDRGDLRRRCTFAWSSSSIFRKLVIRSCATAPLAAMISPLTVPSTVVNAIAEMIANSSSPKLLASSGAAMLLSVRPACRWSSRPGRGRASARRRTRCWRCRRPCSCAPRRRPSPCSSGSGCAAATRCRQKSASISEMKSSLLHSCRAADARESRVRRA